MESPLVESPLELPRLIQAGMGAHISSSGLANITARLGALGVVSGVGLRHIVITQIRQGDTEALEIARTFPVAEYVEDLCAYCPGGARESHAIPMDLPDPVRGAQAKRLSAICAYVEVMRARRGHRGKVGINVMWKCALTVLPTIYGAMLAGADALVCGAGVPMELPDIVARLRAGQDLHCEPLTGTGTNVSLQVAADATAERLQSHAPPALLPILSNFAFCKRLLESWRTKYNAVPTAFVLENHAAGGHNAPPRDHTDFGPNDDLDSYFGKVVALGVPVYVAGDFPAGGARADLLAWQARGAYGIQVGSRFALCEESGLRSDLKAEVISRSARGELTIKTDMLLSPTGYPLKYVELPNTLSDPEVKAAQRHICNLGYLMHSHIETQADGSTRESYVCPAMPPHQLAQRGGKMEEATGRICLCNALFATAGYNRPEEPPLVTLGISGGIVTQLLSARRIVEEILTPEETARMERLLAVEPEAAANLA